MLGRIAFLTCLWWAAHPALAQGQGGVTVQFEPPPPGVMCPAQNRFEDAVVQILGEQPFSAEGSHQCHLAFRLEGADLHLDLMWRQGEVLLGGTRFTDKRDRCGALVQAAAVYASTLIQTLPPAEQPETIEAPVEGRRAPRWARALTPQWPVAVSEGSWELSTQPTGMPRPWRTALSVLASVGAQPGMGLAFGLEGAYRWPTWSVSAEGRATFGSAQPRRNGQIRSDLYAAVISGCWHRDPLALCGVSLTGMRRDQGEGFDRNTSSNALYGALGLRAVLRTPLPRGWALRGQFELSVPWTETELRVGGDTVWRTPIFNGTVGFVVEKAW
ncbi:MAG: hypothetical protein ACE366_20695 [Bradymonadia bacterium]